MTWKVRRGHLAVPAVLVALLVGLGAAACGGSDESSPEIGDPWARTSALSQTMGAVYLTITGGDENDRLVAASVPEDVAGEAQLHETVAVEGSVEETESDEPRDDSGTTEDAMGGQMTMREVGGIDVPAGETVTLEPGGLHVMLLDLAEPLEEGGTFELTLDFETAGEQVVEVTVRDA